MDKFETKMQRVRQWNDADDIIEACVWTKYRFWFCNNPSLCCSVGFFFKIKHILLLNIITIGLDTNYNNLQGSSPHNK